MCAYIGVLVVMAWTHLKPYYKDINIRVTVGPRVQYTGIWSLQLPDAALWGRYNPSGAMLNPKKP